MKPKLLFEKNIIKRHPATQKFCNYYRTGAALPQSVHARKNVANNTLQTLPDITALKQFLDIQDDSISDTEVLRKYNEYKL
ncbi:hypothetical protein DOY81_005155 [Sarcophaga bullata]|nr:hypothetical protein DOY81_005155 [Sarcophaga bullata]